MKKLTTLMIALFVAAGVLANGTSIEVDGEEVNFSWDQAYGTTEDAVNFNGQQFNTDGGFFLLKLYNANNELVKFADVFEEFQIGAIDYVNGPSDRLHADFLGEQYNGHWGTRVVKTAEGEHGTLRGTDMNGALLYGIMYDWDDEADEGEEGLGLVGLVFSEEGGNTSLDLTYERKEGSTGSYTLQVKFLVPFRPGDPEDGQDAEFHNWTEFEALVADPVATAEFEMNVYNVTKNVYYETIQEAIDDADENHEIQVAAGTYDDPVNIDKNDLTLKGAQAGEDARERNPEILDDETIIEVPFWVEANNVTIDGFTFKDISDTKGAIYVPSVNPTGKISAGYSGTKVLNNILLNNYTGMRFHNEGGIDKLINEAVIQYNLFSGTDGGGNPTAAIFFGDGDAISNSAAQANVLIDNNKFIDNAHSTINIAAIVEHTNITVSNNEFEETDSPPGFAVIVLGDSDDVDIIDNTFDATNGIPVFIVGGTKNTTISGNTFEDGDSWAIAVLKWTESPYLGELNTELAIVGNTIVNNENGVFFGEDAYDITSFVNENNIVGNTGKGVDARGTDALDATLNWWGDESGPGGEGPGEGDKISKNVTYSPWLGFDPEEETDDPVTYYVDDSDDADAINKAIASAKPGDIIKIGGGDYTGDVIDIVGITFSPGTSPDCVTITGNFTVTPTTTFDMDIWGATACSQYDRIIVTGDLDITDSSLNIILDGFIPELGSTFTIFTYGTLTGEFDNITVDNPNVEFTIDYGDLTTSGEIVLTTSSVPAIPLSNWALYLGFILMAVFVAIRFRGRIL